MFSFLQHPLYLFLVIGHLLSYLSAIHHLYHDTLTQGYVL